MVQQQDLLFSLDMKGPDACPDPSDQNIASDLSQPVRLCMRTWTKDQEEREGSLRIQ